MIAASIVQALGKWAVVIILITVVIIILVVICFA